MSIETLVKSRWHSVVEDLRRSRDVLHNVRYRGPVRPPPSRAAITEMLGDLAMALFPAHFGQSEGGRPLTADTIDEFVGATLERALGSLETHVHRTLPFTAEGNATDEDFRRQAQEITQLFADELPAIRGLLVSDLRAAYAGDPAATGYPEILLV